MTAISQNHSEFAARLARIERNVANSTQVLFVGVDESYLMPRRDRKPKVTRGQKLVGALMVPVNMGLALALGIVSWGVGRVALFHAMGLSGPEANPDVIFAGQVASGALIALVLGLVLGMKPKERITLKLLGAVLGGLYGHTAVHLAPNLFASLTSDAFVQQVTAQTRAFGLMWHGVAYF